MYRLNIDLKILWSYENNILNILHFENQEFSSYSPLKFVFFLKLVFFLKSTFNVFYCFYVYKQIFGISEVRIFQKVKAVIMRNLRDTIFYMETNALQHFHICISVPSTSGLVIGQRSMLIVFGHCL